MNLTKKQAAAMLCRAGLLAVMVLFTLTACKRSSGGTAASGEKEPVTITFRTWQPGPGDHWDRVVAAWDALNTGITIDLVHVQYSDHIQPLKVLIASGEGPDIYGIQVGAIMKEFQEFTVDIASRAVAD